MTRKFNFLCATALMLLFSTMAFAQPGATSPDVVKDKTKHEEWQKGKGKYPAKPKDMWEIGLHAGYLTIAGDVQPEFGWAAGLHVRKSLGYVFSVRLTGHYGVAKGLNSGPNRYAMLNNRVLGPGRLGGGQGYSPTMPYYFNFRATYMEGAVQGILTLNNLKFHKEKSRWDLFLIAGVGMNMRSTKHDALDASDNMYDFNPVYQYNINTRAERREVKENVRNVLDGTYETATEYWRGLFNFLDPEGAAENGRRVNVMATAGLGLGYRINKRMSVTLEHQSTFLDDDLLDGYRWAEQGDLTRDVDVPQYTHLRVNFHVGNFKKQVMPLWWLNPLDAPYEQMRKNTEKPNPKDMLNDEDDDGVPDLLDKEPGTPADCPVDTRGVTLDSDSDGIPDCQDKEPYSPPGYPVDPNGVAQVPPPAYPTTEDVKNMIQDPAINTAIPGGSGRPGANGGGLGDWFLPMIHFDLDKYYIKPEFFPQLKHVADVMKRYPDVKIVVEGHTDIRKPNDYNKVLSWNRANKAINYLTQYYGIDRGRLLLQFQGEESVLIDGLKDSHLKREEPAHYMNRRVEFRVASGSDSDTPRPEGPEAGKDK